MRALVCSELDGFEHLALGELPEPVAGPGQVLIDVELAAMNFADLLVLQGLYQYKAEPPFAPGMEAVGVVREVGEGASAFSKGQRVAAVNVHGAFAERWVVEEHQTVPVPDDVPSPTAAALTIAYGTSYHALKQRAELKEGETLLVLGAAGGVGAAAVELGKAMGSTVIAAASSDEKVAFCRELGADAGINYTTENLRDSVKELTSGRGVDVIYDPVGGAMAEQAFRSIAWNGRHLVVGFASGDVPAMPMNLPLLKGASIVGVFWGAFATQEPETNRQNAAELFAMVHTGAISPRITQVFSLDDAAGGLAMLADRTAQGRLLVDVS
jgi:NADPH:quinone reductase-like Zn-dependent oxidoreductase